MGGKIVHSNINPRLPLVQTNSCCMFRQLSSHPGAAPAELPSLPLPFAMVATSMDQLWPTPSGHMCLPLAGCLSLQSHTLLEKVRTYACVESLS